MNGLRAWFFTILPIPGVIACSSGYGSLPPDQTHVVTDSLQTESQFDAHQVISGFYNLNDAVAGAFLRTASINIDYFDTNDNLPPPYDSPYPYYPDWPPDSAKYTFVYQNYATTYHDVQNYRWVLFLVNHVATNRTDTCASIQVGTSNPFPAGPNTVPSDPAQRWAFVFAKDVQQFEQVGCPPFATDGQLENEMIHYVTHEFGHQRAGLTDWTRTDSTFHTGPLPQGHEDVMKRPASYGELWGKTDPVFDGWGNEIVGDHTTCRGNLVTNQSVR